MTITIMTRPTIVPPPTPYDVSAPAVAVIGDDGDRLACFGHVPAHLFVPLAIGAYLIACDMGAFGGTEWEGVPIAGDTWKVPGDIWTEWSSEPRGGFTFRGYMKEIDEHVRLLADATDTPLSLLTDKPRGDTRRERAAGVIEKIEDTLILGADRWLTRAAARVRGQR